MRTPHNKNFLYDTKFLKQSMKKRYKVNQKNGCFEWNGVVKSKKYPYGHWSIEGNLFKAHRVSAYLYLGLDIHNREIEVCHKCDNPRCINPKHLFIGSHSENMEDCIKKGRAYKIFGEQHPNSKLSNEQVNYIRKIGNTKKTWRQIAKEYKVNVMTIYRVRDGEGWKHVI